MSERDPVDVAFCVDGGYLRWAAVAALSTVESTRDDRPVRVHVLHDGGLDADPGVTGFRRLLEDAGAEVHLHAVDDRRLDDLPAMGRFGSVVWLRFLLPEVLPGADRALYLDADTFGASSVAPLFDLDLGGRPLGAVANVVEPRAQKHLRALGFDPAGGFLNSGVLLLDLARMRDEDGTGHLLATVRQHRERLLWPDQDALNLAFRDRWLSLHPRWNAQNSMWDWRELAAEALDAAELEEAIRDPGIVHFEGPSLCKPWHYLCHHPWRGAWWDTLRRTPWADTAPEDRTVATRIVKLLPVDRQVPAFLQLQRVRTKVAR